MKVVFCLTLTFMACMIAACASDYGRDGLRAESTDFFQYTYNSNYYLNPLPYYTLHLFPDGNNIATGAFYGRDKREFAFKYTGSENQLSDIEAILDRHDFHAIKTYASFSGRTNHASSYEMLINLTGGHTEYYGIGVYLRLKNAMNYWHLLLKN